MLVLFKILFGLEYLINLHIMYNYVYVWRFLYCWSYIKCILFSRIYRYESDSAIVSALMCIAYMHGIRVQSDAFAVKNRACKGPQLGHCYLFARSIMDVSSLAQKLATFGPIFLSNFSPHFKGHCFSFWGGYYRLYIRVLTIVRKLVGSPVI